MHKVHLSCEFSVSDNQREHAKIINGLEAATAIYEAAIKEITGHSVSISLSVKRHKDGAPVPVAVKASDSKIVPPEKSDESLASGDPMPVISAMAHRRTGTTG